MNLALFDLNIVSFFFLIESGIIIDKAKTINNKVLNIS
jgi:hypothetical protein